MGNATWLADVLRGAGLKVVEHAGWQTRGVGEMGVIRGCMLHHTAGPHNATGTPSLSLVLNGRGPPKPLAGPLSQTYLPADGTWHVLAAGRCNHAGPGAWHGVTAGNSSFIGTEAENAGDGADLWEAVQLDSYQRGVGAMLRHIGAGEEWAVGHKEWALPRGRKIDPSFDMVGFREHVAALLHGTTPPPVITATVDPKRSMLRRGDQGNSIRELQLALNLKFNAGLTVDGAFGAATDAAVRQAQRAKGLTVDGLVGPATWAVLL